MPMGETVASCCTTLQVLPTGDTIKMGQTKGCIVNQFVKKYRMRIITVGNVQYDYYAPRTCNKSSITLIRCVFWSDSGVETFFFFFFEGSNSRWSYGRIGFGSHWDRKLSILAMF